VSQSSSATGSRPVSSQLNVEEYSEQRNLFATIKTALEKKGDTLLDNFRQLDQDGSGSIDASEFRSLLKMNQIDLSEKQFKQFMMFVDESQNGSVDYHEFRERFLQVENPWANDVKVQARRAVARPPLFNPRSEDMRTARRIVDKIRNRGLRLNVVFRKMDMNRDGYLSTSELRNALKTMNFDLTPDELAFCVGARPGEPDVFVDYRQFLDCFEERDFAEDYDPLGKRREDLASTYQIKGLGQADPHQLLQTQSKLREAPHLLYTPAPDRGPLALPAWSRTDDDAARLQDAEMRETALGPVGLARQGVTLDDLAALRLAKTRTVKGAYVSDSLGSTATSTLALTRGLSRRPLTAMSAASRTRTVGGGRTSAGCVRPATAASVRAAAASASGAGASPHSRPQSRGAGGSRGLSRAGGSRDQDAKDASEEEEELSPSRSPSRPPSRPSTAMGLTGDLKRPPSAASSDHRRPGSAVPFALDSESDLGSVISHDLGVTRDSVTWQDETWNDTYVFHKDNPGTPDGGWEATEERMKPYFDRSYTPFGVHRVTHWKHADPHLLRTMRASKQASLTRPGWDRANCGTKGNTTITSEMIVPMKDTPCWGSDADRFRTVQEDGLVAQPRKRVTPSWDGTASYRQAALARTRMNDLRIRALGQRASLRELAMDENRIAGRARQNERYVAALPVPKFNGA